jgi:hypothetical protein
LCRGRQANQEMQKRPSEPLFPDMGYLASAASIRGAKGEVGELNKGASSRVGDAGVAGTCSCFLRLYEGL